MLLATLAAFPSPALAQDEPSAPTRPVPQGNTEVPYPSDATGDAVVLLELVIDLTGTVSSAVVVDGAEPFAEQARRAALAWKFLPATRAGTPVAARIRARVEFHQELPSNAPASETPPETAGGASALPAPSAAGPETPEPSLEVTVRGSRHEIGPTTLSAVEVRAMPGAFGDAFRAIEALPGVLPLVSGLPYFYVRGAPPNDTGYFVDGLRVPQLFHVGLGQSVIHPALLDHVDFFPSAAPASYGGFAGATVAGQTREPATTLHGEAELRLVDVGGLVESPLAEGRGSVLAAARFGYPGPVLSLASPDTRLGYWDYQARATWRLADQDTLGVFAFGSHDHLESRSQRTGEFVQEFASDFHRIDLREDHALADGHLRFAVQGGYHEQGGTDGGDSVAPATVTDWSAAARLQIEKRVSPAMVVRGGADAQFDRYVFSQATPTDYEPEVPSGANPPPTNLTWGAYADVVWHVAPRVEIVPGLRFDVFQSSRASSPSTGTATRVKTTVPAFDPRLSARVSVTPTVALISAVGLSHQYPALRVGPVPAPVLTVPGFPYGDSQLQSALQASQGIEVALPADVVVTATGFWTGWSGLIDLTSACLQLEPSTSTQTGTPPPYVCPDSGPVSGRAYGLELLARRSFTKRLSGWLSYTLSKSTRQAHFVTLSGTEAEATVASEGDHRHVLNAILSYELGLRWRMGGRFLFFTGSPYSKLDGNVPLPPYNDQRYPPFFRADVRVEKSWPLGPDGSLALVFEVQNATLSSEVFGLSCFGTAVRQTNTLTCTPGRFGPITIPSIGVDASF